jgi:V8-like Glu-specific endopeptidase
MTGAAIAAGAQALLPQAAAASQPQHRPPHQHQHRGHGVARGRAGHRPRPHRDIPRTGPVRDSRGRGLRLEHGGLTAEAIGKIFFTVGTTDYVCSGALVGSGRVEVVLTAAHCVGGAHGQRATSWTFVPGYRNGAEPYGEYTARRFFVSPRWTGPGRDERYDVAFVQVTAGTQFGRSRVPTPPPGLAVRFAASQTAAVLPQAYVLGYPALAPFSGEYANYCTGPARVARSGPRAGSVQTSCAMTAGDSGGPWLTGSGPGAAVAAVTAYKLSGNRRTLWGVVLGPAARALYRAATRAWHTIPG